MAFDSTKIVWGGREEQDGSERSLYLDLFGGEVFEAFRESLIFKPLIMSKELSNGRSFQFIHTGKMTSSYHTPGTNLLDSATGDPPVAETTVTVDDLLTSQAFFYNLDEKLRHYELRAPVARQIGHALANRYDRILARVLAIAADDSADPTVTGVEPGFSVYLGAGNELDAQALVDGLFAAATELDQRNAPQEGRHVVLSPAQYYKLISQVDTNILNRDFGNSQGSLNSGEGLYEIAGIKIHRSNNVPFLGKYGHAAGETIVNGTLATGLPTGAGTGVWGERNNYGLATYFANTCGLIFHREAAACVHTIGPTVETTGQDTRVQYQGDLIVGKVAMGAAPVRTTVAGRLLNLATP